MRIMLKKPWLASEDQGSTCSQDSDAKAENPLLKVPVPCLSAVLIKWACGSESSSVHKG